MNEIMKRATIYHHYPQFNENRIEWRRLQTNCAFLSPLVFSLSLLMKERKNGEHFHQIETWISSSTRLVMLVVVVVMMGLILG